MKTAVVQDLALPSAAILAWLQAGETIVLMQDGQPLGRIVPEQAMQPREIEQRREVFARRFAPLATVPDRDLGDLVNDNRGEG